MRRQNRIYPPNCTVCDLNPSRFLAFREKQRRVEAEYGFRLGVPCRTSEQRDGHRRYMRDWQKRYREEHRDEIKAYRSAWLGERREKRRQEREARRAERQAAKDARRAAWEEKCRLVKEKYGFDLGAVPMEMSPEEAEARKRYQLDRDREYRAAHRERRLEILRACKERKRRKLELRKKRIANLEKAQEKQRELKRQREAEAKAAKERELEAKREAFAAKQKVVFEKYGFMLGRTPVTPEEIAGHDRYVVDRDRAYREANRERAREKDKERRRRKAEQRKRLAALNAARATKAEEERRKAKAENRIARRQEREAAAAALIQAENAAVAGFAAQREANRRAYLAAKAARRDETRRMRDEIIGMRDETGGMRKDSSPFPSEAQSSSSPIPHTSSLTNHPLSDAIAADLPIHPFRGLLLDDTAPTDEEMAGEVTSPVWADYTADEQSFSSPIPHTSSLSSEPPKEPPSDGTVTTGGSEDEDDDDWRKREREEKIRRVRELYGFTLGVKPVTPEEIEGKKRYIADRERETAIRNREIDFMLNGKKKARKAAAKKRKATIARKKREAAAQAAREAKAAAKEAERREREAFKAKAKELGVPLQKARWTPAHQKIWDKAIRREAKEKIESERAVRREERKARNAALEASKAEHAKALEEKRRIIREKYGFTLGKRPKTPEEIKGRKRYNRDKLAEERERRREKITAYNREYRRRKRQEALAKAQKKWTSEQWAAWERKRDAKERGTPQWLMRKVVKRLAAEQNLPEDAITERLIELGGLDFLMAGAESMGARRCMNKKTISAAVRALELYLDPDKAAMFKPDA